MKVAFLLDFYKTINITLYIGRKESLETIFIHLSTQAIRIKYLV